MKLRHKFGIVALIYVLSLSVNLIMSGWCIVAYFQSAFVDFQSALRLQADFEALRARVDRFAKPFDDSTQSATAAERFASIQTELNAVVDRVQPEMTGRSGSASAAGLRTTAASIASALSDARTASAGPALGAQIDELGHRIGRIVSTVGAWRQSAVAEAGRTQDKVVRILFVNAACGALLCIVGLALIRRWVLRPVEDLRAATRKLAGGDFSHRITQRSDDELGQLGAEVNQMAGTIVDIQAKLVERERLAAAGEMVTRIAHNIRNPLAGIRGLAEASADPQASSQSIAENQRRIIESVDRFEKWLRNLQQSVSPLELNTADVAMDELVADVCRALTPLANRRNVKLETHVQLQARQVRGDAFHLEQALVALVTNALQASPPNETVRVTVATAPESAGSWRLLVEDRGSGVPESIRDRIFEPYFTTKPEGNGVGLAMVRKIVMIHGGRLQLASVDGQGAKFEALMPGLVSTPE